MLKKPLFAWSAVPVAFLLMTGCSMSPEKESSDIKRDPALLALQKSADQVTRSFERMAAIEQGNAAPPIMPKPSSQDLYATINLPSWTGPMDKAAEAVAQQIGYRVTTLGRPLPVEPIVTVDARNAPAYEVLRNIGLQGGKSAGLRVDTRDRTITVLYQ